ncbi:hypothetical protein DQG23_02640 [Paenibacillus contaminans]|uniref:Uncharacterized protein n=1 Tax=Paenibacillus contaminans TaxID=450362 RepID=A0A329MU54_9BACL|nr:hypothetical protein DQG23_02640 [Paenibacillus contaminans]
MGMEAGKGASLGAVFEIVFLPCNKFNETRFRRLKAYTRCHVNKQTYIEHQCPPQSGFLITSAAVRQFLHKQANKYYCAVFAFHVKCIGW